MEVLLGHKRKQQEFSLVSISNLYSASSSSSTSTSPSQPVVACFSTDSLEFRLQRDFDSTDVIEFDPRAAQVCISATRSISSELIRRQRKLKGNLEHCVF